MNTLTLKIKAGAGGLESNLWAKTLLEMYRKWSKSNNLSVEVEVKGVIRQTSYPFNAESQEETGIDSATLTISGEGYIEKFFKHETGIHKGIKKGRNGQRYTCFAKVEINDEIGESKLVKTYISMPYRLVKDELTKIETSNIDDVIDNGNLKMFYKE